ncbi:flagellar basal body rod protein FlgC [Dysosmobacter sp.]|jgi:flagellar basal-body rod protein FlgC|uniref:flagellar basal body rod protein FlgC n=1 Tax=Dysosmobacter sp. TaxID=2591382 RepID=UPI003D8C62AA
MAFLSSLNIVGSGLTAQQLRLDVISENITNQNTTRTENGGPYRRKMVVLESQEGQSAFEKVLAKARGEAAPTAGGVRVTEIAEDPSDFKLVYDPTNPDANAQGYVEMPNVDLVKEMADAMSASQAYSANVTAFNVLKQVAAKGLEIGQ